ncbi:MAG: ATP phosphoribosyltransferase [Bacteroidetes bacterium]|nr:ATP phosphoribosyltransferase [Bacteroidota bacterium]
MKPLFKFRVGIPKNDRLYPEIASLLTQASIWRDPSRRRLFVDLEKQEMSLIFGRASEIALSLADGTLSCGFTGRDLILESGNTEIEEVLALGIGKCSLVFAVPQDLINEPISYWEGKTIATSFTRLTREFFEKNGVSVHLKEVTGGVEGKVATEEADAIVDLTETGTTLEANGLKIREHLIQTETILAARKEVVNDPRIELIKTRLTGVMLARESIMIEYMIPKEKLGDAIKVAGGQKSPTVAPIYGDDRYFAVRIVEPRNRENEIMDKLKSVGAVGIFSVLLNNTRI